jgi:hypothetical protein
MQLNPYVSANDKFQDQVQETNVKPLVGLLWQDSLINYSICEKNRRVCEFNTELKKSVCSSQGNILDQH